MSNPWLKKNPFMSLWLSTANRMAAQARALVTRQINAAVTQATEENLKLMSEALSPPAARAKACAKRRARARRR